MRWTIRNEALAPPMGELKSATFLPLTKAEMNKRTLLVTIPATLVLLLDGCVVVPAERHYYREPVMVAPPPPREESVGPPPTTGYVWIGGFWNWEGGRHRWVEGHWEAPRHGHHWVPHQWGREGDHWRLHEGHWD